MASLRRQGIYAIFILTFLFLQYCLWFESGGIRDMRSLKTKLAMQIEQNKTLGERNEQLLAEINRIKHSHETAESRARAELGMIKKGETFYQIVEK